MKFVCDSTFLIAIYLEMEIPTVLEDLNAKGFEFYVPKAVYDEVVKKHESIRTIIEEHIAKGIIKLVDVEIPEELESFLAVLGDGEKEVIAYSYQNDFTPILDEKKAREIWNEIKGDSIKTGRFMVNCVKEWEILDELTAIKCLIRLRKSNFWIKDEILLDLIEKVLDC